MAFSSEVAVIEAIQKYRTPALDLYFSATAFLADEPFYLVALPTLIWSIDDDANKENTSCKPRCSTKNIENERSLCTGSLGKRLTYMVIGGLSVGNFLKDFFAVERPSSSKIWRSPGIFDSTNLLDCTYPSTHSMNSVTNSLFFLHQTRNSVFGKADSILSSIFRAIVAGSAVSIWIGSISIGRMYLGAHYPTDVKAGLALGMFLFFVGVRFIPKMQNELHGTAQERSLTIRKILTSMILFTIFYPRGRRLASPTYFQCMNVLGLFFGCALGDLGSRRHQRDLKDRGLKDTDSLPFTPLTRYMLRKLIGFAIVVAVREGSKAIFRKLFESIGLKPAVAYAAAHSHISLEPSSVRKRDLIAETFVRFVSSTATALSITLQAPRAFRALYLS